MDKSDAFIARVYNEDINLCLDFNNKELGVRVQDAVERGNIFIEAVSDKTKTVFPKQVSQVPSLHAILCTSTLHLTCHDTVQCWAKFLTTILRPQFMQ
jgi:hypothetical protein